MAKKKKAATSKKKTTTVVDENLREFLVRLAVDPVLRALFNCDPEAAMKLSDLSDKAQQAILARDAEGVGLVLDLNNQDQGGDELPPATPAAARRASRKAR